MEKKHFYKNHEHVIYVLTTKYGFEYTGIGNNYEECFFKDSETPERIFIHPMFCSYHMYESRKILSPRLHHVCFESDIKNKQKQKEAFNKLLLYIDKYTVILNRVTVATEKVELEFYQELCI
ncbi:hypothetical protein K8Q94_00275 [Candidatus Nomurabacteria bacterium]|nr:hypothetical protein [Candidatus Nomurabacteria bacterium]